jgi:hypothetical protein
MVLVVAIVLKLSRGRLRSGRCDEGQLLQSRGKPDESRRRLRAISSYIVRPIRSLGSIFRLLTITLNSGHAFNHVGNFCRNTRGSMKENQTAPSQKTASNKITALRMTLPHMKGS